MNKEIKEIFYAREENASREIKEARDNYRREFARDRDRILYSRAFRRLSVYFIHNFCSKIQLKILPCKHE